MLPVSPAVDVDLDAVILRTLRRNAGGYARPEYASEGRGGPRLPDGQLSRSGACGRFS